MAGEDAGVINRQMLLRKVCGIDVMPDRIVFSEFEHLGPNKGNSSTNTSTENGSHAASVFATDGRPGRPDAGSLLHNLVDFEVVHKHIPKLVRKHMKPSHTKDESVVSIQAEGTTSSLWAKKGARKLIRRAKKYEDGGKLRLEMKEDATLIPW